VPAGLWQAASGSTPATGNYVYLKGDSGDYIVGNQTLVYTQANSILSVSSSGAHFSIGVSGDANWTGDVQAATGQSELLAGYYKGATRYPFQAATEPGLSWDGDGRGCNMVTGWFVVDDIAYDNGSLSAIDLRFEQHCEGGSAALHGQIHWTSSDPTRPPGPVDPPPAGLWQPAPGSTPATGNYVYLKGDSGDYIVGNQTLVYTQANALLKGTSSGALFSIGVTGDTNWTGDFKAMSPLSLLEPGYYGDLERYPFSNPAKGGLSWSGDGRGCNTLGGWFVVDHVAYDNGSLSAIDLRFEQHCEGGSAALHGQIHWTPNDPTTPPGPVDPPPAGLWQPAPGSTPATGNYVYLKGDSGDYIVGNQTLVYTQADASLSLNSSGAHVSISVTGDVNWTGDFQGMSTLSQLAPGYYGNLERYPFQNPVKGGLDWSGNGRGCNTLSGWFVVDDITYDNGSLSAIDLRFEQHCEGGSAALHGQIHWTPNDPTPPPGPLSPPPSGLWQPAQGSTPATGNYVYLVSDSGDYIGGGQTLTVGPDVLSVSASAGYLSVRTSDAQMWFGDFSAMRSLSAIELGYYGDLSRYPFQNPVKGGLSWSGNGRGCNTLTGWFVVDGVTYDAGSLKAIDLRFEQHCEGAAAALHGQLHYVAP
jgi:hypothetical protein